MKSFFVMFQAQSVVQPLVGAIIVQGNDVIQVAGALPTLEELNQAKRVYCEDVSKRNNATFSPYSCSITFFHEILPA